MNKPKKPSKKIEVENYTTFYFDFLSKKVSIQYFNSWIKETLPKDSYDVTIALEEEPEYCYCEDQCDHCPNTYLRVYWKQKIVNKRYDVELRSFKKKLTKWKKNNE